MTREPPQNHYRLSDAELAILQLITQGHEDPHIAAALGMTLSRLKNAITRIKTKMRVASRTEAAVRAIKEHLVP
jgi:DNA-binding NarL/FixJ family response regulator